MCGGSGTRLWPLSRKNRPKQFIPLIGEQSLFDLTLARALQIPNAHSALCLTSDEHGFQVEQAAAASGDDVQIILEPVARNTAPALGCAALHLNAISPESIMVCLPADHICPDTAAFSAAAALAIEQAERGLLMTLGVEATEPNSGYGYIIPGDAIEGTTSSVMVSEFVEKPDLETAQSLISAGARWNAGIFIVQAKTLAQDLATHAPDIFNSCKNALHTASMENNVIRLDAEAYSACRSESIDYAVLEKSKSVGMEPLNTAWSDVGSWEALAEFTEADTAGNRSNGDVQVRGSANVFVQSPDKLAVVLGAENLIVVDTPDAILVAAKDQAQALKDVVAELEASGREEVVNHKRHVRPWGTFESLDKAEGYQVKRLTVNPGASLSLQYHHHRSEHWVVVSGTAKVTCDENTFILGPNETTFIPQGATHRLENTETELLQVIEVQFGSYLGEDDIVRLEDVYGRIPDGET